MNEPTNNRTLALLADVGVALEFLWQRFLQRLEKTSWWKTLLISMLALILGAIFAIGILVALLVVAALSIKAFRPRQQAANTNESSNIVG